MPMPMAIPVASVFWKIFSGADAGGGQAPAA